MLRPIGLLMKSPGLDSTIGTTPARPRTGRVRWYIGGLLFLSTVINYIDRQTLSVLAPYIKSE
jgi:hypothetical protein